MRNYYFILCIVGLLLTFSSCAEQGVKFSVSNKSDFDRIEELVEIPLSKVDKNLVIKDGEVLNIADDEGNILVSQITYDNRIIFQPQLKAGESKEFKLISAPSQNFEPRVYANYHPERYGDMAWENDKLGFRFYGKPLEEIQAPTSGLDLWYKRTSKIVLDDWYKKDISKEASYHKDHGEGCDPYPVGRTLGGGSMSPIVDGKLLLNDNFISHEILENGPLRSTFKLVYPAITIYGKELTETKIVSLEAGSYLTKISQEYSTDDQRDHFNVAAGFAKRTEGDKLIYEKGRNYMVYQEPASEANGQIFLGLIILQGIEKVDINSYTYVNPINKKTENHSNTLAYITYMPGAPAVYYTGFGWTKFGFDTVEQFEEYVSAYSKSLKQPLLITYSNNK